MPQIKREHWEKVWADPFQNLCSMYSYFLFEARDRKVLEVGCGDLSFSNLPYYKNFFIGVDVSFNALKRAKNNRENLKLIVASATDLPFKDNSFDDVVCAETLPLLGCSFYKALEEMIRVTRNRIILTFVHLDIIKKLHPAESLTNHRDYTLLPAEEGDFVYFTESNLETILRKMGLTISSLDVLTEAQVANIPPDPFQHSSVEYPYTNSRIFVEAIK